MRLKNIALFCILTFICYSPFAPPIAAQNHTSVSLENQMYYILEQAELRGLCAPLSGIRPYTRNIVITIINEILNSENAGRLKSTERDILQQYLNQFTVFKQGMDWQRGMYNTETSFGKNLPLSLNIGTNIHLEGSASTYSSLEEFDYGTEVWIRFYLSGDIGYNVSWEFAGEGGLTRAPRDFIGTYHTYYDGFTQDESKEYYDREIDIYSEPLTHFPYTYKKRWDGSIYFFSSLSTFEHWPQSFAGAYNLQSELAASFFNDKLILRAGRLPREWSSTPFGSSLSLNQAARPFLGIEAEFQPVNWFSIASMTGVLEYYNSSGIKDSAMSFQNFYSISLIQFRTKYFSVDLGEAVVWSKRFELGYMIPIINSIFYQNNIGDFDNMSMILSLKAQYPGLGSIWASLFWDEAYWVPDFYELDRTMISLQVGANVTLPLLSFSSIKFSYTRVNPYTYTHNRNFNPWYGNIHMETSYTNNGVNLGYYLPPNSDEILVRITTMPSKNITTSLQYQLIRHGADFGSRAVDGSNILSELDPIDRDGINKPILRRYFLKDGAYQWRHIIKMSAEWTLGNKLVSLLGEAGAVISYFTDTTAALDSGQAHPYSVINTPEYPKSTGYILKLGIKIYPR